VPDLRTNGGCLHYEDYEAVSPGGAPVVLLHGLGSCGDDWPLQVQALTDRRRVLTLDLPGHGRSTPLPGRVRIADFAAAVLRLLEVRREPAVHLVGLSLGGAVALQLAADAPQRVLSLTAVNTFARLRPAEHGLGRGLTRLRLLLFAPMDRVGEWVALGLFPREDQAGLRRLAAQRLTSNRRRTYLRSIAAVLRFDLRARLGEIVCPTLVVAGDRDRTVPLAAKLEIQAGIRGARFQIVGDSGHATPLDAPQAFNTLLLGFLDEVEGIDARSRE